MGVYRLVVAPTRNADRHATHRGAGATGPRSASSRWIGLMGTRPGRKLMLWGNESFAVASRRSLLHVHHGQAAPACRADRLPARLPAELLADVVVRGDCFAGRGDGRRRERSAGRMLLPSSSRRASRTWPQSRRRTWHVASSVAVCAWSRQASRRRTVPMHLRRRHVCRPGSVRFRRCRGAADRPCPRRCRDRGDGLAVSPLASPG